MGSVCAKGCDEETEETEEKELGERGGGHANESFRSRGSSRFHFLKDV